MTSTTAQPTCRERWAEHKRSRMADLRRLWAAYQRDPEESVPDLGTLNEYGMSFDYVAPDTFKGQPRGYWRYQLSWGGPSDEIRLYGEVTQEYGGLSIDRTEYAFLDWFDGHSRALVGRDAVLVREIMTDFQECGTLWHTRAKSVED